MGKLAISMASFNSKLLVYQRVTKEIGMEILLLCLLMSAMFAWSNIHLQKKPWRSDVPLVFAQSAGLKPCLKSNSKADSLFWESEEFWWHLNILCDVVVGRILSWSLHKARSLRPFVTLHPFLGSRAQNGSNLCSVVAERYFFETKLMVYDFI